jgi:hypothetical protein
MVEPFSDLPQWLALGGASAWTARRVLGGSLDVIGETLERWTRVRLENVARITDNAAKKSGASLDSSGTVPARVAMRVFEEGSYSADDLVIEYLGGVLASSRTELGRDDRGNGFTRLVAGLSTCELRHHYVSYAVTRRLLLGRDVDIRHARQLRGIHVFVPDAEWSEAMDFGPTEDVPAIHLHTVLGLSQAKLLQPHFFRHGPDAETNGTRWGIDEPGEVFTPTLLGILLYFWAHGVGNADIECFVDPAFALELPDIEVALPGTARLIDPPEEPGA